MHAALYFSALPLTFTTFPGGFDVIRNDDVDDDDDDDDAQVAKYHFIRTLSNVYSLNVNARF